MPQMNAACWFDIYVDDLDRATKFYETVFDTKLDDMPDPTGETQMKAFNPEHNQYGAGGALTKSPYNQPGPGGTVIYFAVEDCANEEAKIAKAGGQILQPKFSIGEFGFCSLCQDTEGNVFGLNSMT